MYIRNVLSSSCAAPLAATDTETCKDSDESDIGQMPDDKYQCDAIIGRYGGEIAERARTIDVRNLPG